MSQRHLIILTKIIMFYSIFVVVMKLIFLFQQYNALEAGADPQYFKALALAHAVIIIPFIALAVVAFFKNKKEEYSWIFVVIGAAVIIGIRAFEMDLIFYLRNLFL